jgi:myo-inositol 2-dehydrogenase / D-chiro-inositol 1-dehydrogenase
MAVRVGVIGTGLIGQDHIRRLATVLSDVEVVAVSDIDIARARRVADGIAGARVHATGQELIADREVDAVLVASSGQTHEEYVLTSITAGKPVFCEKPLATTEQACLNIIDAEVACSRRLVQLGFMRRYDAAYVSLKQVVASGAIGAPLFFHSAHRNPSVPSTYLSEMALNDTAVHDIDIARFLLDDEVAAVSVMTPRRNRRGGELRDPTFLVLEMRSGALVDVEISVNIAYGYDIRGEIVGEAGVVTLAERNQVIVKSNGAFSGHVPADWRERFACAYDLELRAWLEVAAKGGATGPSSWDGYAATVVADAALAAQRSGTRTAIAMRDRPRLYSVQT